MPTPYMFETLMTDTTALLRHRTSPLAKEREEFLRYLETCGTSKANIRITACYLLQIIRLLRLRKLRDVTTTQVNQASRRWARRRRAFNKLQPGPRSATRFGWEARRWMRFAGRLRSPRPHQPFSRLLGDFVQAMRIEQGLAQATIKGRGSRTSDFLKWYAKRHRVFREVSVENLDSYLLRKGPTRNLVTISSEAATLRAFFRWAEGRKLCCKGIAASIKSPILRHDPCQHRGPTWPDVVRLLDGTVGNSRSDIRAHALLQLFVFYGIRAGESVRLRLDDIDWHSKTLLIRRSKRGGRHHFPLHDSVAKAIRRYIVEARPRCTCPNVFVTLNGPYRPLIEPTVSAVVHSRMVKLGVTSLRYGPQALRHSCATRLLKLGASPAEIADFLGHRNTRSVQVYAKSDFDALRQVSDLDLVGAL
jgi:integrase/recombinase XerD